MARPAQLAKSSRPHVVPVPFSEEEDDFVRFMSEDMGMARATYIRSLVRIAMRDERERRGR